MNFAMIMQVDEQIESDLINLCDELGFKLDINYLRGTVAVDTGHRKISVSNATEALDWVRQRQREIRKF